MSIKVVIEVEETNITLRAQELGFEEQMANLFGVDKETSRLVSIGNSLEEMNRTASEKGLSLEGIDFHNFLENDEVEVLYCGAIMKYWFRYILTRSRLFFVNQLLSSFALEIRSTLWPKLSDNYKQEFIGLVQREVKLKNLIINGESIDLCWALRTSPERINSAFYTTLGYSVLFLSLNLSLNAANMPPKIWALEHFIDKYCLAYVMIAIWLFNALKWQSSRAYFKEQKVRSIREILSIPPKLPSNLLHYLLFSAVVVPFLSYSKLCIPIRIIPLAICGIIVGILFDRMPMTTGRIYRNDVLFPFRKTTKPAKARS